MNSELNILADDFIWFRFFPLLDTLEMLQVTSKSEVFHLKLHAVMKSRMLPHLLVVSQWFTLILILVFNVNFSILVTGALGSGGLKVITLFHIWALIFSVVLFSIFLKIRKEGIAEKSIAGLSLMIFTFSIVTVYFHFVDDLVLPMKVMEFIVWSLHNCVFSISVYKILVVLLLPLLKR